MTPLIALVITDVALLIACIAITRLQRRCRRFQQRYAEALGLLALVARAEASPAAVRQQCEALFVAHDVTITVTPLGRAPDSVQ